MKSVGLLSILLSAIFCMTTVYSQETLTITTYYPAPFGVYTNLRLFPSSQPACAVANDEGVMYFDSASHQLMVCTGDAAGRYNWQGVGTGYWRLGGTPADFFIYTAEGIKQVGIGTTNPQVELHVKATEENADIGLEANSFKWTMSTDVLGDWILNRDIPGTFPALFVTQAGLVGVGNVTSPQTRLDVAGGIRVGDDPVCNVSKNGLIRYTSAGALQYCHNGAWTAAGGNFGGMYQKGELMAGEGGVTENNCETPNPFTGHCSCPAGFTDTALSKTEEPVDWGRYRWDENHFCWR